MKNALSLLAVITVSGLIFWFGALFGQDRADLNRLSFETAMLINEINFNKDVSEEKINQNHVMIRENLERYADYLDGEYPFYKGSLYQIDKIKESLSRSIAYAASEITTSPRDEVIKYWENVMVDDPNIKDFAKSRVITTNRYYDLIEASELDYKSYRNDIKIA